MKRAFLFFTILTLCLSCAVSTNAARMVQTFSTEYYQIFIPGVQGYAARRYRQVRCYG